ncbi:hypothetical protein EZV76_00425 [Flagellimonas alvinocaridis]|uniref:Uncharacterized protein n=1 Tax=Flagellimonas alvinocaridis TaxID=2530200 RepID=A0A4S8RRH7_9FLAO|nr:hypothetical protein [Allomuricauda alvinocaridis]THV60840.1 hypothetical protein EZV76_00425 [Allomuricauda alvinocaridis]
MISISDKMFITKEVNLATIAYFKKIVLRKSLMDFSFGPQSNNRAITDLFKSVNYYGFDLPYEIELALFERLRRFKNNLDKEELTALYFWGVNQKYLHYLEDFEYGDDTYSDKEFDWEFGRSLAYKIYEPNNSGLEEETMEELKVLLCNFAGEFDLSLVDEYTYEHIIEIIDLYCLSSNNSIPVF